MPFRVLVYPDPYGPGKGHLAGYYTNSSDFPPAVDATDQTAPNNIWVIGYDVARIQRAHILLLYLAHNTDVQAEAAQDEIPQVWHPTFVRSQYAAPLYGLTGANDTAEGTAAQPETLTSWQARRLQGRYNIRRDLLFTTNDVAPVAAAEDEIPQSWRGRQLLGRYNVQRHLLFAGDGATSETPATPQDEIAQVWRKRSIRTEWVTPTYGLGGAADTAEGAAEQPDTLGSWRARPLRGQYNVRRDLLFSSNVPLADLAPFATQDEISLPWRKRAVRSEWTTPTYGLGGNADTAEGAAPAVDQPDTTVQWRPRQLPNQSRVQAATRYTLWQGDLASDASFVSSVTGAPLFIQYAGSEYRIRRDLLFGNDVPIADLAPFPTQDEINSPWRKRAVRTEWTTPLYGLNGAADSAEGAPFTTQDDIAQVWRKRTVKSEYAAPLYGLTGSPEGATGTTPASTEESTVQSWTPKKMPLDWRIRQAMHYYIWQGDLASSAETIAASPSSPMFIQYAGREYTFRRDLLFAGDTTPSAPATPAESETNTNQIGRYKPGQHRLNPALRFQPDVSQSAPTTPEADTLPQWHSQRVARPFNSLAASRLLYGSPDTSLAETQLSTVVQWRPRFLPNQYWIRQASRLLYGQPDTSSSAPTVPVPVGSRRRGALWMRRLELENVR